MRSACLAIGLTQAAFALAWWIILGRQKRRQAPPPYGPRLTVFVPCKGAAEDLVENARSLLSQDYPGPWELLFVVPTKKDPAFGRLKPLIEGAPHARLLASEQRPDRCSGKILDLLFALKEASADSEVFLFADADILAGPHWARELVRPLLDPAVGAATTACLYAPREASFWAFMKFLWMGAGLPYFAAFPFAWGGSTAIRRETFEDFGIAGLWERSALDDGPLDNELKRRGRRVVFVASAMPVNAGGSCLRDFFGQFNRWLVYAKYYKPLLWLAGGLGLFAKAAIAVWALRRPSRLPVLGWLLAIDAAYFFLVFAAIRVFLDEKLRGLHRLWRAYPLWAALLSPLVNAAWLINFLRSGPAREIRWGGMRYRLRGPFEVEASATESMSNAAPKR